MSDDAIISALLESGLDDWLMLHDVVWEATQGAIDDTTKTRTKRVLARLFNEHLAVPGILEEGGFTDWPEPEATWLNRAISELERLNWEPMGNGFWLRLTDDGERVAQARPET